MARQPWLAVPMVLGLFVAFGALVTRLQQVAFGAPRGTSAQLTGSLVPLYAHLAIVFVSGFWLPGPVVAWLRSVASAMGG